MMLQALQILAAPGYLSHVHAWRWRQQNPERTREGHMSAQK
jgi:hypothetical protein